VEAAGRTCCRCFAGGGDFRRLDSALFLADESPCTDGCRPIRSMRGGTADVVRSPDRPAVRNGLEQTGSVSRRRLLTAGRTTLLDGAERTRSVFIGPAQTRTGARRARGAMNAALEGIHSATARRHTKADRRLAAHTPSSRPTCAPRPPPPPPPDPRVAPPRGGRRPNVLTVASDDRRVGGGATQVRGSPPLQPAARRRLVLPAGSLGSAFKADLSSLAPWRGIVCVADLVAPTPRAGFSGRAPCSSLGR
jgi:hypothetical protein